MFWPAHPVLCAQYTARYVDKGDAEESDSFAKFFTPIVGARARRKAHASMLVRSELVHAFPQMSAFHQQACSNEQMLGALSNEQML
eukprot:4691909-Pleurochrysis_carterae.AAC.3